MTSNEPDVRLKPLRFDGYSGSFADLPDVLRTALLHQTNPSHPTDYLIEDAKKAQELLAALELLLPQMSAMPESLQQSVRDWASKEAYNALESSPEFLARRWQTGKQWLADNLEPLVTVLGEYVRVIREAGSISESFREGQLARIYAMRERTVDLRMYALARQVTPRTNALMDELLAEYEVIKLRSQNGPGALPEARDLLAHAGVITAKEEAQAKEAKEAKAAKAALRKSRRNS